MANESTGIVIGPAPFAGVAPGLVGVYGRLRIEVAGRPVGTLVVEGVQVMLSADASGPADATVMCSNDEHFRKLLKGDLNVFIASMRGWARLKGDRNFGSKVMLGLKVGSPFNDAHWKGV